MAKRGETELIGERRPISFSSAIRSGCQHCCSLGVRARGYACKRVLAPLLLSVEGHCHSHQYLSHAFPSGSVPGSGIWVLGPTETQERDEPTRPSLRAVGLSGSSFHGRDHPYHPCRVGWVIFTGDPSTAPNALSVAFCASVKPVIPVMFIPS